MRRKSREEEAYVSALERDFLSAYDEYADSLFRHCLIRVRDREVAKDLVQEAFSRAWVYLAGGKKVTYMRAFLYRVANNLIVDHARRKRSSSLDSMMEEDGFEPQDETLHDPAEAPQAREALKMLDSLDEVYRVAITMRFLDEMSPREIAEALSVSENVVSVRIHRGIEKMRMMMDQKPQPPNP